MRHIGMDFANRDSQNTGGSALGGAHRAEPAEQRSGGDDNAEIAMPVLRYRYDWPLVLFDFIPKASEELAPRTMR